MRVKLGASALLAAVTLAVFWRVQHADFLIFDDHLYVTKNAVVKAGLTASGLRGAFTETRAANWHPLTWLSHMLDVELYGVDPAGHHRTSLLLHAVNAVVLFLLLASWTAAIERSLLVAALFALHPLHVESVAWISERKDVLFLLLGLLALGAWTRWVRAGGRAWYMASLGLFTLGLLAKPMLVTLPFVLLLLDVWPLERLAGGARTFAARVAEKLPFFVLAAASGMVTYLVQQQAGAVAAKLWLGSRVLNALMGYAAYLRQTVWPLDLAVYYPFARAIPLEQVIAAAVLLAGLSALAVATRRRRPYLFVGWFWFVGTLVPVIGLVQVGGHAHADRYTYLPHIGLFVAVVWGAADGFASVRGGRRMAGALALAGLAACAALSARQVGFWRDQRTLFEHALEVTEGNHVAHAQLASWHLARGERDAAIERLTEAVRLRPTDLTSQVRLARELFLRGDLARAETHYDRALAIEPANALALNGKGLVLWRQGRLDGAIRYFGRAVAVDTSFYDNLVRVIAERVRSGARTLPPEAELLRPADREALLRATRD